MLPRISACLRGSVSLLLFGVFGLGSILITPLILVLRRPERGQPLVRISWRLVLWLFSVLRLLRLFRGNLHPVSGAVVVANHPSLIDVVCLTVLLPRTLYVAKHGLLSNPILSAIVRSTALPDNADLMTTAGRYLAEGWNVLIFPEGTRTPPTGKLRTLHRGAAQLALRTGAPLVAVRLDVSRRVLGKGQPPWDVGSECVTYACHMSKVPCRRLAGESLRGAAVRVTHNLAEFLSLPRPQDVQDVL